MNSITKLNYKIISHLMGLLLMVNGGFMLLSSVVSWYYKDGVLKEMLLAGSVALGIGGAILLLTKNHRKEIQKREGYIIVTFGWIFMALIGTLPYIFTGAIPSFTNAFFET
ncbi:MAG TPA: potassium transporter, partial [Aequorivita sp.]|nr:potassium transporter [Aequorivita sp.]